MTQTELPTYAMVLTQIEQARLAVDASELHGSLSGFLCAGGEALSSDWLPQLALEGACGEVLQQLFVATSAQLRSPDFSFALLLPDDEQGLEQRADALVAWCRGFLGGFGMVADASAALSEESRRGAGRPWPHRVQRIELRGSRCRRRCARRSDRVCASGGIVAARRWGAAPAIAPLAALSARQWIPTATAKPRPPTR